MTEKTFHAAAESLPQVIGFVEEEIEKLDCPMKVSMSVCVCVEEMFVNVANYAYPDGAGDVDVIVDSADGAFCITLIDSGIQFNPLAQTDPDITLSADERNIGGLGIFMVKKSMDEVFYERKDGKNIFTMKKNI